MDDYKCSVAVGGNLNVAGHEIVSYHSRPGQRGCELLVFFLALRQSLNRCWTEIMIFSPKSQENPKPFIDFLSMNSMKHFLCPQQWQSELIVKSVVWVAESEAAYQIINTSFDLLTN